MSPGLMASVLPEKEGPTLRLRLRTKVVAVWEACWSLQQLLWEWKNVLIRKAACWARWRPSWGFWPWICSGTNLWNWWSSPAAFHMLGTGTAERWDWNHRALGFARWNERMSTNERLKWWAGGLSWEGKEDSEAGGGLIVHCLAHGSSVSMCRSGQSGGVCELVCELVVSRCSGSLKEEITDQRVGGLNWCL